MITRSMDGQTDKLSDFLLRSRVSETHEEAFATMWDFAVWRQPSALSSNCTHLHKDGEKALQTIDFFQSHMQA